MTTTDVRNASARLIAYLDLDEIETDAPGSPGAITANRPHLAKLIDDLRLALASEDS